MFWFDHLQEGEIRIDAGGNYGRKVFVAGCGRNAYGLAVLDQNLRDADFGLDLHASFAGRIGNRIGDCACSAARKAPGAEGAVDLAHVVMKQNVSRAGRAHAEKRSDNSRRRHGGLEHVGLEPLVEEIDGAHGHQLHLVVLVLAAQALEAPAEEDHLEQIFGIERRRVRRDHGQDRLHEAAHLQHGFAEFFIGLGVEARMAAQLAHRLAVIVHAPQIIAVGHRREGAVERKDFQTVAGKIEIANDLRPQQRDHVRADGKFEAGNDLFGASRAADDVTALQHQDLLAGAREIGGVDQAVVPAADDDGVVTVCIVLRHEQDSTL